MMRIYLSKLDGDGTAGNPYRPAWWSIVEPGTVARHGVIESRRYHFWIGQIDTDTAQHAALIADSRVRWLNDAALGLTWAELSQQQRDKAAEIVTWLGFEPRAVSAVFTSTATVRDLVHWLLGKACWTGLRAFREPDPA